MADFDFLVIGAGSAGCVLASRLARVADVAVIEAGGDRAGGLMRRPGDYVKMFRTGDDWSMETTPQPELAGRRLQFPRGKGVGGTTRINASIWLRPLDDCIKRLSDVTSGFLSSDQLTKAIDRVEQIVSPEPPRWLSDSAVRFCSAAKSLSGLSGDRLQAEPFLRMNQRGARRTAADAFLGTGAKDRGPKLLSGCLVERLEFHNDRAVGALLWNGTQHELVTARKGVILCAGSIASPSILQRSGIGCRTGLGQLGIDCRVDLPAVGEGLRDHLIFPVIYKTPNSPPFPSSWSPRQLARWRAVGRGNVTTNLAEAGLITGFGDQRIQLHVTPTDYLRHPSLAGGSAMTIGITGSHPASSGRIEIASRDPLATPIIDPAYFSAPSDLFAFEEGLKLVRQIAAASPLNDWLSEELVPGKMAAVRSVKRFAQTLYHPVGGCVLGAVLEGDFRVKVAERLWVVDASVFPRMPAANPNPLIMGLGWAVAEKLVEQLS